MKKNSDLGPKRREGEGEGGVFGEMYFRVKGRAFVFFQEICFQFPSISVNGWAGLDTGIAVAIADVSTRGH